MNKKGHLGTVLMVFGALVLTVTALFTFVSFKDDVGDSRAEFRKLSFDFKYNSQEISFILNRVVQNSIDVAKQEDDFKVEFEKNLRLNAEKERNKVNVGDLLGKIANGDYDLKESGEKYSLEVRDVSVKLVFDSGEIHRNFDVLVEFDKTDVKKISEGFEIL
jgi:hypothetical protein